jgi:hypothetical protein
MHWGISGSFLFMSSESRGNLVRIKFIKLAIKSKVKETKDFINLISVPLH